MHQAARQPPAGPSQREAEHAAADQAKASRCQPADRLEVKDLQAHADYGEGEAEHHPLTVACPLGQ